MMKYNKRYSWLIKYTITFIIVSLITYSLQLFYGKSFIYSEVGLAGDGLVQHYNALAYYGNWMWTILKNIFLEHRLSIPEFDMSIGLGGDIISTLNFYAMGDPLNLLAVFVPCVIRNICIIFSLLPGYTLQDFHFTYIVNTMVMTVTGFCPGLLFTYFRFIQFQFQYCIRYS